MGIFELRNTARIKLFCIYKGKRSLLLWVRYKQALKATLLKCCQTFCKLIQVVNPSLLEAYRCVVQPLCVQIHTQVNSLSPWVVQCCTPPLLHQPHLAPAHLWLSTTLHSRLAPAFFSWEMRNCEKVICVIISPRFLGGCSSTAFEHTTFSLSHGA